MRSISLGLVRTLCSSHVMTLGARLGVAEHKQDNARVFDFKLTPEDQSNISDVLAQSHGQELIHLMGDCGAEYR